MSKGESILLRISGISKDFPGVKALDNINLDLKEGEVHALVGENGAGKSTLMNILSGACKPDCGEILLDGRIMNFRDPKHAQDEGIAMIHQELSLAPSINVIENIFIGRLKRNILGFVDYKTMHGECLKMMERLGVSNIDPYGLVRNLSISQMQLIEIAKALSLNARIIIMDEPTSSLTLAETRTLLSTIRTLKAAGAAIVYISHRLEEVKEISDRITVLRDGRYIDTVDTSTTNICDIVSMMVGRSFERTFQRVYCKKTDQDITILEVKNLCSGNRLKNISFRLGKGEILGLTGLVGSGRTELVQSIFGAFPIDSGELLIDNKKVRISSSADAVRQGMGLVPEGRKTQGLFLKLSVRENISLVRLPKLSKLMFIRSRQEQESALEMKDKLRIKTPSIEQRIQFLSGGNQQKSIIARWLLNKPRILFLDEPTHGVDIGAKAEIYEIINKLANEGVSIILVSSELPEVLMLCDRVAVMYNGMITGILNKEDADQETIMSFATNQFDCTKGMR